MQCHTKIIKINSHSETALNRTAEKVSSKPDEGNRLSSLVLLDISKAFDGMNHELLSAILFYVGFGHDAITLMRSYFNNRTQFRETFGAASVINGPPQGSILGPILFSIYSCNLVNCLKHCNAHLYADDTQLYLFYHLNQKVII